MKNAMYLASLVLLAGGVCLQAQGPAGARAIGAVTAIDAAAGQIAIRTDAGAAITLTLKDNTSYLRVGLGEKDLKNAAKIALSDIAVGDRVLARGAASQDNAALAATSVVVMSKADIAKKHEADHAEWQKRGVFGIVSALNPATKEITISVHKADGTKPMVIPASGEVDFRRYAPDSVRFADAKPSSFADLRIGDQLKALGTKSEDGSSFTPEFIVSGAFRNVAGTVISVDVPGKTVKITDLDTKKPALVRIAADSTLRKLQPFAANMLAMRVTGAAAAGSGGPGRPPGGPGRAGAGDLDQLLERMPALDLADLKAGDALIISSTKGAEPDKITAITLLAGVEPILTSAPKGRPGMILGNWNLGGMAEQ